MKNLKNTSHTYYEVRDGSGTIGKNGKYSFESFKEAKEMIVEFKANPRSHNEKMEDSSVTYWKNREYTIIKRTVTTEEISII